MRILDISISSFTDSTIKVIHEYSINLKMNAIRSKNTALDTETNCSNKVSENHAYSRKSSVLKLSEAKYNRGRISIHSQITYGPFERLHFHDVESKIFAVYLYNGRQVKRAVDCDDVRRGRGEEEGRRWLRVSGGTEGLRVAIGGEVVQA